MNFKEMLEQEKHKAMESRQEYETKVNSWTPAQIKRFVREIRKSGLKLTYKVTQDDNLNPNRFLQIATNDNHKTLIPLYHEYEYALQLAAQQLAWSMANKLNGDKNGK